MVLQQASSGGFEFATKQPIILPPDQISVLTLPWFFAIPTEWRQSKEAAERQAKGSDLGNTTSWEALPLHKGSSASKGKAVLSAGTALSPCC